jgi:ATP-dependent Clp protease ATP-binding subunit ClpC
MIDRGILEPATDAVLTPRAKNAIELAANNARRQNSRLIGTRHLMYGLIRVNDGTAATVLEILGVDLKKVLAELEHIEGEDDGNETEER